MTEAPVFNRRSLEWDFSVLFDKLSASMIGLALTVEYTLNPDKSSLFDLGKIAAIVATVTYYYLMHSDYREFTANIDRQIEEILLKHLDPAPTAED
jgi:uncharacterized membrane protein